MDNKKNEIIVCPKCGTRLTGNSIVCGGCGHNLKNDGSKDVISNNNEEYSEYTREHIDKSDERKTIFGIALSALMIYVVTPIAIFFVIGWFLFGGLSNSSNYASNLIIGLAVLIVSLLIPFVFIYKLAKKESSERDKKIFFIGIFLLLAAAVLFFVFR